MIAAGALCATSSTVIDVRNDLRIHPRLAHPPGDQLGVLGAEIDDENRMPVHLAEPSDSRDLGLATAERAERQQATDQDHIGENAGDDGHDDEHERSPRQLRRARSGLRARSRTSVPGAEETAPRGRW